jgi:glycosyltransferase involved in cell wall biosynthesis
MSHQATDISLCIPTCNRASHLREAIASVLGQSVLPAEILVVDDGSVDDTEKVSEASARQAPVPCRYVRQDQLGAPAARNRCIAEARSAWILWLDDDDILLPNAIEQLLAAREAEETIDVFYAAPMVVDEKLRVQRTMDFEDWHGRQAELIARLFHLCVIANGGALIRKQSLEAIGGYDESFSRAHDYEVWSRLCDKASFRLVKPPYYLYRMHSNNITVRRTRENEVRIAKAMLQRFAPQKLLYGAVENAEQLPSDIASALAHHLAATNAFRRWQQPRLALELVERGIEIAPLEQSIQLRRALSRLIRLAPRLARVQRRHRQAARL